MIRALLLVFVLSFVSGQFQGLLNYHNYDYNNEVRGQKNDNLKLNGQLTEPCPKPGLSPSVQNSNVNVPNYNRNPIPAVPRVANTYTGGNVYSPSATKGDLAKDSVKYTGNSRRLKPDYENLSDSNQASDTGNTETIDEKSLTQNDYSNDDTSNYETHDELDQEVEDQNEPKQAHSYEENNKGPVNTQTSRNKEQQVMETSRSVGTSPIVGFGSNIMLLQNSRVCYACNSLSDDTCWEPNRRTTVKYCYRENDACVTKTLKDERSNLIVVRDCARSCDEKLSIFEKLYRYCSICYSDMCNSQKVDYNAAHSVSYHIGTLLAVSIAWIFKYQN